MNSFVSNHRELSILTLLLLGISTTAFAAFNNSGTLGEIELNPLLHNMKVGGGFTDMGGGTDLNDRGTIKIYTPRLTNPLDAGYRLTSNQGGVSSSAQLIPVYGKTNLSNGFFGRSGINFGLTSKIGNVTQTSSGHIGFVVNPNDSQINTNSGQAIPMNTLTLPYAFYTTQQSGMGGDVYVQDNINNGSTTPLSIIADVDSESTEINGSLTTDYIELDNSPFRVEHNSYTVPLGRGGDIVTANVDCLPGGVLTACSGYVQGADSYSPYRGVIPTDAGICNAQARVPNNNVTFTLHVYAYCLNTN